jgi:parallel beta-helix repeat protein
LDYSSYVIDRVGSAINELSIETINLYGKFNTIKGLTIIGGMFGVDVVGRAYIDNNIIENAVYNGIHVALSGFAHILNNTIQNNQGVGIMVWANSTALIGITFPFDTVEYPNTQVKRE